MDSKPQDCAFPALQAQARRWLALDPEGNGALAEVLEDEGALRAYFNGRLSFGTAGLRGPLGAGSRAMNLVVVSQSARGFGLYLKGKSINGRVVIGYDARRRGAEFARASAEILQGLGLDCYLSPEPIPTPLLAYALQALDCHGAIMVTASHNPAGDQGYKVYVGKAQIIAPEDQHIAAAIDQAAAADVASYPRSDRYKLIPPTVFQDYWARSARQRQSEPRPLNFVYSALHGVATKSLLETLKIAAINPPLLVAEQCTPDGDFPTLPYPNPEAPGVLDRAINLAEAHGYELVLANDPDGDRLAVAVKDGGHWQPLTGNQIGLMLAWHLIRRGGRGVLASSLVSSPQLATLAARYGLEYRRTLTGFKYLGRVENLLFAYEEALGFLVDADKVRDKDGISAAVALLDLALAQAAHGHNLLDYWREFTATFGHSASGQLVREFAAVQEIAAAMNALRARPPTEFAGLPVENYEDFAAAQTMRADMLLFELAGARLIFRPSGTEPKLKIYLDVVGESEEECAALLARLRAALA